MFLSICSTNTGQLSSHAPQVVQSQSSSRETISPRSVRGAGLDGMGRDRHPPKSGAGPFHHMGLEILDYLFGGEGFAAEMSRTVILTAAAARAGVKIHELFLLKVPDAARPIGLGRFKMNQGQCSLGPQGAGKHVEGRKPDVLQAGPAQGKIGQEEEGGEGVNQGPVPEEELGFRFLGKGEHELRKGEADWRPSIQSGGMNASLAAMRYPLTQ